MLMSLSGCYFGPIELVDSNAPPVIKDSNYLNGETIVIEQDRQFIYVYVQDEEPEFLSFSWTLSRDGIIPDAERYLDGRSQVSLSNSNTDLEGQILRCLVSDGSQTTSISWPLEVVP